MSVETISIDLEIEAGDWPQEDELAQLARRCVQAASAELDLPATPTELSLLFTDNETIRELNAQWRGKDKPTNVLSFPAFPIAPGDAVPPMLGDIVLASETVHAEAELENKPFKHHLSHLMVHGFLHLLGYDHEEDEDAETMEQLERQVLERLAIPDPYG